MPAASAAAGSRLMRISRRCSPANAAPTAAQVMTSLIRIAGVTSATRPAISSLSASVPSAKRSASTSPPAVAVT
jgi:hypothetical protein